MKKILCITLSLLLAFTCAAPAFAETERALTLAAGNATDYRIVVPASASEVETTAAGILADTLGQITGASFPIVTDAEAPADKEIAVGVTNRETGAPIDRAGWDEDAVRILTDGQRLFLTGGEKRGALYAVYTFLEDQLGCRWFTHELTVIPTAETLTVPEIDYFYEPCFKLRQTYWMFSTMYADYCAAHKLHGVMAGLPDSLGGGRYDLAVSSVHTMQQIVPPSLFETHPEYFGCDDSGARSVNRQPCLRNEAVFDLALAYARAYFSRDDAVILSVSQNDGMDFCRCDACKAFNAAHGGTDSAALLDFVNRLAVAIRAEYPGATLETLAYQNSQTPPEGLSVEPNVVIRLCPISTCTLHALDDPSCPSNARFDRDLSGWSAITDRIYIWEYSTNFQYYYAPFPNLTAMQARYRYYRDHNVVSIFDHGCGEITVAGEFHELRTYLVLKLLWDPDTDLKRHMREFCAAYYGDAGDDVIDFICAFESAYKGWNVRAAKVCHNSCQDGGVGLINNNAVSSADVKKLDQILDRARARMLTGAQADRLEGLSLSWRFFKNAAQIGEFSWYSGFTDPEAETARLIEDMRAYGIVLLSENWGLYLRDDREADARLLPTFWYTDEVDLPAGMLTQAKFRSAVHRVLYAVCTPLRAILSAIGKA